MNFLVREVENSFNIIPSRHFTTMGLIPDGWNDYVRTGKRINRTRFIAFKVPLREAPNEKCNIREENKWYPKLLVTLIPDIGLIIDITNTSKYYNPQDFLELGVDHVKIFVQGHHIPSKDNYKMFRRAVKKFLQDNKDNDKLIGVHCTHGLNRTGFLVCRYMIEEMKMTAGEAISLFEDARGHKIKRENYINKLKSLAAKRSPSPNSESNSGNSSLRITERPRSNSSRSRRYNPYGPTSRTSPPDNSNANNWRSVRPSSRALSPERFGRSEGNRHAQPLPLPYASLNSNWRDRCHYYPPPRSMYFNSIPQQSNSKRNQRYEPRESNRSSPPQQNNSSRYTWRRD